MAHDGFRSSVSPEDRARLAAMQAVFLQSLTGSGAVPEGFDATRIHAAGESLASKRMRSVVRAWPALTASLGAEFALRFAAFAAMNPLPGQGGPLADGRAFARSLTSREGVSPRLSDGTWLEIMAVDLRYRSAGREGGLVTRHGFAARVAMLREARRGVLAVRLPYFGERWLSLPFTWRSSSWVALNACSGRRGAMSRGDKEAERAGDVEIEPNAVIG